MVEKTFEEVEKAVEKQEDIESLKDVDLGLLEIDTLEIAASERFSLAVSYQRLSIRASTSAATAKAMKNVGNTSQEEKFKKEVEELEIQKAHCLRGIKEIDSKHSGAKKRMQQIANAARQGR